MLRILILAEGARYLIMNVYAVSTWLDGDARGSQQHDVRLSQN